MPELIGPVAEDLNKLFEHEGLAAIAPVSESGSVVEFTIGVVVMLVIALLITKHLMANFAPEVLHVVFAVKSGDIRPSK